MALLLVLAVAGCGSEAESSSGATASSPDTAAAATATRVTSSPGPGEAEPSASSPTDDETRKAGAAKATQQPKATPKAKAPRKTAAPSAGGTKYKGCADGDCKVSFSGSVTFPLARWTVSASVEDGGVRVRLTKPNGLGGGGGFLAGPGCSVAIHADGGGRVGCDRDGAAPERGGYVVHLLKLDGDTAVVRAILG